MIYTAGLLLLQISIIPLMYVKIIMNSFHIAFFTQTNDGIERYLHPFYSIIASPFLILLSILTDLVSMPTIILQNE